jgi:hypothetical protein
LKTLTAIYKGNRIIELTEGLELAENTVVLVVIPEQADEDEMRLQLTVAAQGTFAKLWDNEEDKVWSQQLSPKGRQLAPQPDTLGADWTP